MGDVNLYESPALRSVSGPVLRPGGFELTTRGLTCCDLTPGAPVLDVGCGTGATVDYMRQHHGLAAVGLDVSTALLEEGSRTFAGLPLVRGRAEQLPMADGSFGAVLCECVLSLCQDPLIVLGELRRILQPGGYLVLTDVYTLGPDAATGTGVPSVRCCLQGAVSRTTVEARITATGYHQLRWEDHSERLRQLAARIVWTYGSLSAFWSAVAGPGSAGEMAGISAGGCRRPGYFLSVARKA
jgi:arsenite methyltransferase